MPDQPSGQVVDLLDCQADPGLQQASFPVGAAPLDAPPVPHLELQVSGWGLQPQIEEQLQDVPEESLQRLPAWAHPLRDAQKDFRQ